MGSSPSSLASQRSNKIVDFKKKLYIDIDLYIKPKFDQNEKFRNYDIEKLKLNSVLKKNLKDILLNAFTNKGNYNALISENNILLISKIDKNNIKYLELNVVVEFVNYTEEKVNTEVIATPISTYISPNDILSQNTSNTNFEVMKLNVLSELFKYVSNQYGIIIPELTIVILANTLNNIHLYQK
jgi:hypothetical protein